MFINDLNINIYYMINLIFYLERINQHYNINSNFLIHSEKKSQNIFDSIDELYVFLKSIDYINEVLKENKIKDILEIRIFKNQKSDYFNLLEDFINKKIYSDQLKQKLVEYYINNNEIKKLIQQYHQLKKENSSKIDSILEKISRSLFPKSIQFELIFKNKHISTISSFPFMNFKSFFDTYHEILFHLLSSPRSVTKFDDISKYGSFGDPKGYSPEEILKELFALQTNHVTTGGNEKIDFLYTLDNYNFFEKLKFSFDRRRIPLTWKKFRDVFKNYPKIIKLFPTSKYPDDHYFFYSKSKKDAIVTPGSSEKILKLYNISQNSFHSKKDSIKNFEGEIAYVLSRISELIKKIKRKDNSKYIKQIFKDPEIIKLFDPIDY
jgi:hypothetical protein